MAALQAIHREEPHPVLLFTNDPNTDKIETATQALRQRAVEAEQKLAKRKLIDRAKAS